MEQRARPSRATKEFLATLDYAAFGAAMMGRINHEQEQFFYSFRLDEAVPEDHPVREIAAVLDLSWVHSELAPYYPKLGRPSIDPVLMIRMLIVGVNSN